MTFASTIIIVKLLSEKRDLQSLYGKIVVGIFLLQDFVVIFILIFLSSLSAESGSLYSSLPTWQNVIFTLVRMLVLLLLVAGISTKIFPKIIKRIGNSEELMLIFSLAWALGLGVFVSMPIMGFSLEIGGFLAGLSLASSAVHYEISAKIKPLRDFFVIIFFIVLGSGLAFSNLAALAKPAILLSLFILIINPLIVMLLLAFLGYKPRTGFLAGVTVAQISEFSLILAALGHKLGHLSQNEVGLVTLIGIITIALSSYMILYSNKLYEFLKPLLQVLDFRKGIAERHLHTPSLKNHIILVGAHRLGHHIVSSLIKQKRSFVVVDFNPEVVEEYIGQGVLAVCGDIADGYIQEQINLPYAKTIISTVPDLNDNIALLEAVKKATAGKHHRPKLIFIAQDEEETKFLYNKDIDYVISPHFMGGLHLAKLLEGKEFSSGLKKLREHHLQILMNNHR